MTDDVKAIKTALAYASKWLAFQHQYNPYVGAQVAVRVDGELLMNEAFGMADIENDIALTTDHLFRIASHSKTFTGIAIMQLVEAGKLRLDDTVGQHIPELAGSGIADVTVRQLASHMGGVIRDGDNADWWELGKPFPNRKELLTLARKHGKVLESNVEFKYSNIGFSLLGVIIEHASGMPYRDYVTANIVDKLGLKDTGPDLNMDRIDDYAVGYSSRVHGPKRIPIDHIDTFEESSATGFYATASDLTGYFQAHISGDTRLITDASKRTMQQKIGESTEISWYGIGLVIEKLGDRTYIGHSGGYPGHITMSKTDVGRKLSVSVLTNTNDGPAAVLCAGILALIELAVSPKAPVSQPGKPRDLKKFEGRFATLWGLTDIVNLGGRLYALAPTLDDPAGMAVELEVTGENTLKRVGGPKGGSRGEEIVYHFDAKGKVSKIEGGHTMLPVDQFTLPERVTRPTRK
ncbi:MAG: beta-lactamase family protein [Thermomicrobiales bacterium]|nr:beta-lactamase family protein [Thermomicrobiales bacterium]